MSGGLDPVAAALSQVGLPSPVCVQTAVVPLVNPAIPLVADLLGGAAAIPGLGVCGASVDEQDLRP